MEIVCKLFAFPRSKGGGYRGAVEVNGKVVWAGKRRPDKLDAAADAEKAAHAIYVRSTLRGADQHSAVGPA